MRTHAAAPIFPAAPAIKVRPRRRAEVRDPYDGLRPWSALTHGAGAILAAAATVFLLVHSATLGLDAWHIVSFAIYGASMICLYTASALYHSLNVPVAGRLALRKVDHCSISLLIAGSYTPICLLVLGGRTGFILLSIVWGIAIIGILLKALWVYCPRWVSSVLYIGMGWTCV